MVAGQARELGADIRRLPSQHRLHEARLPSSRAETIQRADRRRDRLRAHGLERHDGAARSARVA
jgi:hypothetical protein